MPLTTTRKKTKDKQVVSMLVYGNPCHPPMRIIFLVFFSHSHCERGNSVDDQNKLNYKGDKFALRALFTLKRARTNNFKIPVCDEPFGLISDLIILEGCGKK